MEPLLTFACGVIFGVVLVLISVRWKKIKLAKALHESSGALKASIEKDKKV